LRDLLVTCGLAKSGSEAFRKIEEGAVEVDGESIRDRSAKVDLAPGKPHLVRLGRRWIRLVGDPGIRSAKQSEHPVRLDA
jgi:tyrosyl-tRNA synthetase